MKYAQAVIRFFQRTTLGYGSGQPSMRAIGSKFLAPVLTPAQKAQASRRQSCESRRGPLHSFALDGAQ